MRISDWSSDVCSSDLLGLLSAVAEYRTGRQVRHHRRLSRQLVRRLRRRSRDRDLGRARRQPLDRPVRFIRRIADLDARDEGPARAQRSEEHTSELQSLMRISYAVFCLKKKK